MPFTVIGTHWFYRLAVRQCSNQKHKLQLSIDTVRPFSHLCDQFGSVCSAVAAILAPLLRGNPATAVPGMQTQKQTHPHCHLIVVVRPADPEYGDCSEAVQLLFDSSSPNLPEPRRTRVGGLDDAELLRSWEVSLRGRGGARFLVAAVVPGIRAQVYDPFPGVRVTLMPREIADLDIACTPWEFTASKVAELNDVMAAALSLVDLSGSGSSSCPQQPQRPRRTAQSSQG